MEMSHNKEDIRRVVNSINHLMDNCLHDFNFEQTEKVRQRYTMFCRQKKFWASQDNWDRYCYDILEFAEWLCDYIAFVSESS